MIHYMNDLRSSEILFVKSVLQIAIFGTASVGRKILRNGINQDQDHGDEAGENDGWTCYFTICLANLGVALIQYLVFIAFKLLPVSDLMVFCFSTPILDLFLSACILRYYIADFLVHMHGA